MFGVPAVTPLYKQICYNRCLLETAWTRVEGMMIWSAAPHIVSVSTSCSRCCYLALSPWFPHVLNPHVYLIDEPWTCINSVDTFLYPYTLPILQFPYPFSSLCLSCNLSSSLRSLQDIIEDAQSFSSKAPITPSRGFSVETLIVVTPSWKTKLNRSISAMKDGISGWL